MLGGGAPSLGRGMPNVAGMPHSTVEGYHRASFSVHADARPVALLCVKLHKIVTKLVLDDLAYPVIIILGGATANDGT